MSSTEQTQGYEAIKPDMERGYADVERGLSRPAEPNNAAYMAGWNAAMSGDEIL